MIRKKLFGGTVPPNYLLFRATLLLEYSPCLEVQKFEARCCTALLARQMLLRKHQVTWQVKSTLGVSPPPREVVQSRWVASENIALMHVGLFSHYRNETELCILNKYMVNNDGSLVVKQLFMES